MLFGLRGNKPDIFKYIEKMSQGDFICIEELANS